MTDDDEAARRIAETRQREADRARDAARIERLAKEAEERNRKRDK